ncbi:MAG: TOBE-like domain-containing protein, partial [Acidimicrobiales bacterium]
HEIVVINAGRVEQIGTPVELYEKPANDFVMGFLGPVTRLGGVLVRPHDLEVFVEPEPDATPITVERVVRLGFEVRIDARTGDGEDLWVQVTRGEAERLALGAGTTLFVRPVRRAVMAPTARMGE